MTRELIIEGQQVDLAPDTDITLEYANDITGDLASISLSHSYTIKLPRTLRNTRILDDPGAPGHASKRLRRYLSARFFRNGVDLIGAAQAYVLKTTPEAYEVALVWNAMQALQALSQSSETLNDLPGLPVLTWIGSNGKTPDYAGAETGGALFASYNSGLGEFTYPAVNAATHPCMRVSELFRRILSNAGIPYSISTSAAAQSAMEGLVLLAAPSRTPDRAMEIESGSVAERATLVPGTVNGKPSTFFYANGWIHGWDAPSNATGSSADFTTGDIETHRVLLNLRAPASANLSGAYLAVSGRIVENYVVQDSEELLRAYFKSDASGWYLYADEEINLSGWSSYGVTIAGVPTPPSSTIVMSAYDPLLPLVAVNRVHKTINLAKDNLFPLAGNLPDLKQWDFIKGCLALLGIVPVIQNGQLRLLTYAELLRTSNAYDWTSKVDMTDGGPQEVRYTLSKWARVNEIAFEADNEELSFSPNACIEVADTTLAERRDYYKLPFAASMQSNAIHYKLKDDETEVEGVDIAPRIFRVVEGDSGRRLEFTADLYGAGVVARYGALQAAVRTPVVLTVNIRLHELDLAQLDLARVVYLGQFGQYYKILKVQTSDTDLCKVELLQIA